MENGDLAAWAVNKLTTVLIIGVGVTLVVGVIASSIVWWITT